MPELFFQNYENIRLFAQAFRMQDELASIPFLFLIRIFFYLF